MFLGKTGGAEEEIAPEAGPLPVGRHCPQARRLPGVSEVLRPAHAAVANAVGAAIAQVSGEADQVFQGMTRTEAMAEAERVARARAVDAGADGGTLALVDIEDLPIAYLPGGAIRVRARVVGEIAAAG